MVPDSHPEAATPELAVVSAAVHGAGPDGAKAFAALLDQLDDIEPERAKGYIDEVLAVLPEEARDLLERMMTTGTREYKSDFARRYTAEGRAEGVKRSILTILSARGVAVPDEAHARLAECSDLDQLEAWVRRAVTAGSIDELFD